MLEVLLMLPSSGMGSGAAVLELNADDPAALMGLLSGSLLHSRQDKVLGMAGSQAQ